MAPPVLQACTPTLVCSAAEAPVQPAAKAAAAEAASLENCYRTDAAEDVIANAEQEEGVREWLTGQTVLLTGATGFLGSLLLEKLLRACPEVRAVYLLVRDKKGESGASRLERLLEDPLFNEVRDRIKERAVTVTGDVSAEGLGLAPADEELLLREVTLVLHCAATVRFDAPLRQAAHVNVRATADLVRLARRMPRLQSFVHVSTAYAYCPRKKIGEELYKTRMSAEHLLSLVDALDDDQLERVAPTVMSPWPNSYCFTKALVEDMLRRQARDLPICVFRPSMVLGCYREPLPGWINNVNGPTGVVIGAAVGILRTVYVRNIDTVVDMIPGDLVTNATLAAAWATATDFKSRPIVEPAPSPGANSTPHTTDAADANRSDPAPAGTTTTTTSEQSEKEFKGNSREKKIEEEEGDSSIPVYNCISSAQKPITWANFMNINIRYGFDYPSEHCLWYYCLFKPQSPTLHALQRIILHLLPALLVDLGLRISGRKPMLWRAYKKIHKFMDLTSYFGNQQWTWTDDNMQRLWQRLGERDKQLFFFDVAQLDWEEAVATVIPGLRQYFLKDPLDTVPKAKIKYNRLRLMHYTLVAAMWLLAIQLFWWVLRAAYLG